MDGGVEADERRWREREGGRRKKVRREKKRQRNMEGVSTNSFADI